MDFDSQRPNPYQPPEPPGQPQDRAPIPYSRSVVVASWLQLVLSAIWIAGALMIEEQRPMQLLANARFLSCAGLLVVPAVLGLIRPQSWILKFLLLADMTSIFAWLYFWGVSHWEVPPGAKGVWFIFAFSAMAPFFHIVKAAAATGPAVSSLEDRPSTDTAER